MDLKIIVTFGKGSNMQKMLENQRMFWSWRIFLKNSRQEKVREPGLKHSTPEAQRRGMSHAALEAIVADKILFVFCHEIQISGGFNAL